LIATMFCHPNSKAPQFPYQRHCQLCYTTMWSKL